MTEQVINTGFLYIKKGQENTFEKFRNRAQVILESYGAKIERVIKPSMIAHGELDLPSEIHFATYPNMEAMQAFSQSDDYKKLQQEFKLPEVLEKMFGFITKASSFQYYREHGDTTKTHGVALIWYNEGEKSAAEFASYHADACKIIPEFGGHFERFLLPVAAANDVLEQPNEIHRFFFDSPEGLSKMKADERMQQLFPRRDSSLKKTSIPLG